MNQTTQAKPKRVVSGMRPTGQLHLGHWLGALRSWLELQQQAERCFFFSADWHALTTHYADSRGIAASRVEMLADWLAVGLDPRRCTLFSQGLVPQHAELFTLLAMIVPIPWLERVPSYKEVRQQLSDRDLSTLGFLGYPLLQTADIALYRADSVPVGDDQLAHIELAREVIRRFNKLYCKKRRILVEPQGLLAPNPAGTRLPGLDGRKMSKSYDNAIYLADSAKQVQHKLMRAMTDPARVKREDPGDPERCPVFRYQLVLQDENTLTEIRHNCSTAGWGCVECKQRLLSNLQPLLEPIRHKRTELLAKPQNLEEIWQEGSQIARAEAEQTMQLARDAIGVA